MKLQGDRRALRVFVCSVALFAGGAAAAQEVTPSQPPPALPQIDPTVTVTFPGGTLPQYVQALRGASDGANIVLPEEAADVHVPPLTLKNATVLNALDILADLVAGNKDVRVRMLKSHQGQPVYAVRVSRARSAGQGPPGATVGPVPDPSDLAVRVASLRSLTHGGSGDLADSSTTIKPETILSALETGLSFSARGSQKAVVRYHPDSGIVFVQGTYEQVNLVEEILANLNRDVSRARQEAAMPRPPGSATKEARTR